MKDSVVKFGLILLSIFTLTACRQEPMIQLSEANKAKIEAKKNQKQETSQTQSSESETTAKQAEKNQQKLVIDKSNWQKIEGEANFSIADFIPLQANEIRSFTNGQAVQTRYLLSVDDQQQIYHLLVIQDQQLKDEYYSLDETSMNLKALTSELNLFAKNNPDQENLILFQLPLTISDSASGIQAIYQQADIAGQNYQNVLEVATGNQVYYFAQGIGLIAEENTEETWLIQSRNQNVKLITSIPIVIPQSDESSLLTTTTTQLSWQTNQDLAATFTSLFQSQKLIGEDIQVNQVTVTDAQATIDFSPGVVATFNAHPQGEKAVIAAIVANAAQWLGVNQVQLTVNQYGLAPDTFAYPDQGLYHFDAKWFETLPTNLFDN